MSEPSRLQRQLDWRQRACRLLVERYGSVEADCDDVLAPLCLLELSFEGFAHQVSAESALPSPRPYSLMEYIDVVADALDEYLLGDEGLTWDEGLTSMRMDLFEDTGLLRTFLLLQCKSYLLARDYCDDSNGWGQVRMSLHRVFLRIGPMVSDFVRDVSVEMLDLGD